MRLEALAWEELCRMAVPNLHRVVPAIAAFGPLGEGQRYWRGNDPELDIVARSVTRPGILVGEAKWSAAGGRRGVPRLGALVGDVDTPVWSFLFTPDPSPDSADIVDARMVLKALR